MSKILIDESTVKLVLEALERMKRYGNTFGYRSHEQNPYKQVCEAITALREALAEQPAQQEPLFWYKPYSGGLYYGPIHNAQIGNIRRGSEEWEPLYTTSQPAQQEPVAWAMYQKGRLQSFWMDKGDAYDFEFTSEHSWAPLYTTPQPAQRKPLTLQELEAAWNTQADKFNQWDELGLDEIVAWAQAALNIKE